MDPLTAFVIAILMMLLNGAVLGMLALNGLPEPHHLAGCFRIEPPPALLTPSAPDPRQVGSHFRVHV